MFSTTIFHILYVGKIMHSTIPHFNIPHFCSPKPDTSLCCNFPNRRLVICGVSCCRSTESPIIFAYQGWVDKVVISSDFIHDGSYDLPHQPHWPYRWPQRWSRYASFSFLSYNDYWRTARREPGHTSLCNMLSKERQWPFGGHQCSKFAGHCMGDRN